MYTLEKEAQIQLNYLLRLPATGREQDWDIELADSHRLNEFMALWVDVNSSRSLKRALAALLIASYDDYLQTEPDADEYRDRLYQILGDRSDIQDIISYWAMNGETNRADWFSATPFARHLLAGEPVDRTAEI